MKQEIVNNHYFRIPEFISRDEAFVLAQAFKDHAISNCSGDDQAPQSHAQYNFLPFVRLLVKKVPDVSMFFGEDLLPTYTYSRVYKHGSVLERHRDRVACEVSLTINLSKSHDWPIYFQRPDGSEAHIELEPGDAVMYMGCVADHWRNYFVGEEYTQVFLHYVKSYGENAWAYFDKSQETTRQPELKVTLEPVKIKNKDWQVNVL
jgi:ribosomal protein S18 acetylase RimI-like enzyme